jgi:nucleoside-diphosphate-sugar epimerase
MKVLVTGANGFVGSHILDTFRESGFDVAVLLRKSSDTAFIEQHLDAGVSVHYGSLSDTDNLARATAGVEAVVHCAGQTKAFHDREYLQTNREGTRNLVDAVGRETVRHFVFVSSLSVSGPGVPDNPARENDPPQPVSAYGQSKLAAEKVVESQSVVPWTILRPAAIYGPRDRDFLSVFRAVRRGVVLVPRGGRQSLSLVYARDVADAVRCCLLRKDAEGKIYHVASEPPSTGAGLVHAIARVMDRRVRTFPVPGPLLYTACVVQGWVSRRIRRPHVLSRQKWRELNAPGWVCTTERIREDLDFTAPTSLEDGLAETAAWYAAQGWL